MSGLHSRIDMKDSQATLKTPKRPNSNKGDHENPSVVGELSSSEFDRSPRSPKQKAFGEDMESFCSELSDSIDDLNARKHNHNSSQIFRNSDSWTKIESTPDLNHPNQSHEVKKDQKLPNESQENDRPASPKYFSSQTVEKHESQKPLKNSAENHNNHSDKPLHLSDQFNDKDKQKSGNPKDIHSEHVQQSMNQIAQPINDNHSMNQEKKNLKVEKQIVKSPRDSFVQGVNKAAKIIEVIVPAFTSHPEEQHHQQIQQPQLNNDLNQVNKLINQSIKNTPNREPLLIESKDEKGKGQEQENHNYQGNKKKFDLFFDRNQKEFESFFEKHGIVRRENSTKSILFTEMQEMIFVLFEKNHLQIIQSTESDQNIQKNKNFAQIIEGVKNNYQKTLSKKQQVQPQSQQFALTYDEIKQFFEYWIRIDPNLIIKYDEKTTPSESSHQSSVVIQKPKSVVDRPVVQKFAELLERNIRKMEEIEVEAVEQNKQNKVKDPAGLAIVSSTLQFLKAQQKKCENQSYEKSLMQDIDSLVFQSKGIARLQNAFLHVFREYALVDSSKTKKPTTFDEIREQDNLLNINHFFRFVKDYEIQSSVLTGTALIEIFHRHSTAKLMNFVHFFAALVRIVEITQAEQIFDTKQQMLAIAKLLRIKIPKNSPKPQQKLRGSDQQSSQLSEEKVAWTNLDRYSLDTNRDTKEQHPTEFLGLTSSDLDFSVAKVKQLTPRGRQQQTSNSPLAAQSQHSGQNQLNIPQMKSIQVKDKIEPKALSSSPRARQAGKYLPVFTSNQGGGGYSHHKDRSFQKSLSPPMMMMMQNASQQQQLVTKGYADSRQNKQIIEQPNDTNLTSESQQNQKLFQNQQNQEQQPFRYKLQQSQQQQKQNNFSKNIPAYNQQPFLKRPNLFGAQGMQDGQNLQQQKKWEQEQKYQKQLMQQQQQQQPGIPVGSSGNLSKSSSNNSGGSSSLEPAKRSLPRAVAIAASAIAAFSSNQSSSNNNVNNGQHNNGNISTNVRVIAATLPQLVVKS